MAAVVCKVNKLRYPDECYAKVQQMKNITVKPRQKQVDYKMLKSHNYERHVLKLNRRDPPDERPDTEDEESFLVKRALYDQFLTSYWQKRRPQIIFSKPVTEEEPEEKFMTKKEKKIKEKLDKKNKKAE